MEVSFLFALLIVVAVLLFSFGTLFLLKKNFVKKEDLEIVKNVFNLSVSIIDELNLKQENLIKEIGQIVLSSIDFAILIADNKDDIKSAAYEQTCYLCNDFKIDLTDSRKVIIKQLIDIGLSELFQKDEVESRYVRKPIK